MIRSNSKKAIENIRAYIMRYVDVDGCEIQQPETFRDAAMIIWQVFQSETKYNVKRMPNTQARFENWCSGLPSILDTCYYYNRSAVDDLALILEETDAEKVKYTEEKAEKMLTWLLFREIEKEARKRG